MQVKLFYTVTIAIFLTGSMIGCQPNTPVDVDVAAITSSEESVKKSTEDAFSQASEELEVTESQSAPDEKPLIVDISATVLTHEENVEELSVEDETVLPDFFSEGKGSNVRASAKLLVDEENPNTVESIDGIEISVEKKF